MSVLSDVVESSLSSCRVSSSCGRRLVAEEGS